MKITTVNQPETTNYDYAGPSAPVGGGSVGGVTNEEYRAAKLAQDAEEARKAAEIRAIRGTADDPFRYNPRFNEETGYFTDADGNFGLGILPENHYYNDYSGTQTETQTEGTVVGSSGQGSSLPGGGGGIGGAQGDPNGQDPFAPPPNYQPGGGTGLPNGGIPDGYLPDSNGNDYWDYDYNGGNVPIRNPYVPGSDRYYNNLELGTGGVQGPTGTDWSTDSSLTPDLMGYESSSNKDFYQQQFANMRGQEAGNDAREAAAAIRAQESANAPPPEASDPWAWANLPEVQMGGTVAATPIEWGLNSNYGINKDMTNRQAVGAIAPVLNTDEIAIMNKHWQDAPQAADNNNWLTSDPQRLSAAFSQNTDKTVSPEFTNVMQKVFNNLYTQTGGGTGGINVPAGYANPIGA